jgi:phosphomannomutase
MNYLEAAKAWLSQDPDPQTQAELAALIESQDLDALQARFATRLEFGTAGLRGELGAGPNRMNRVVVAQAALAIARFLLENKKEFQDPQGELSVVIGYDGRINSDVFAKDSAEIFAAQGIKAKLFDSKVPTPVACFTGAKLGASATIVVTASHNPPRDNGYKVYLGGPLFGSQLVPPQDAEIAAHITEIAGSLRFEEIPMSKDLELLGQAQIDDYISRAEQLSLHAAKEELTLTYTAMHGVGYRVIKPIFDSMKLSWVSVAQQQEPDGTFPTVSFPNPEEPGAMDLALETARHHDSDLIIANDPDADRLAVGVRSVEGYRMLTGDEVGLILAEELVQSGRAKVIANSIVSASLAPLASHHGVEYQQTLTGFKWISKVPNLGYGYEEALGYCVDPSHTPDKDGITAAVVMVDIARRLKDQGLSLLDHLAELYSRYGHLKTGQVSIRVTDLSVISKIMRGVRENPLTEVLGDQVEFEDLALGLKLQKTDGVIISNQKLRMIIRPSGTEPKLKCYLQYLGESDQSAATGLAALKGFASDYLDSLK